MFPTGTTWTRAFMYGTYGEHSSPLRNFEGFKLVTILKETKEAKCKLCHITIQFHCPLSVIKQFLTPFTINILKKPTYMPNNKGIDT